MWELDHKESWWPKNWCFQIMMLQKTLENRLNCKEIKPVSPKGNQPWIFIGKTDAEAPILWPPDVKSQLILKDPVAGKDWRQKEKGAAEGEMVGWHHRLDGHEVEHSGRQCVLQSVGLQRVGHEFVIEQQRQCSSVLDDSSGKDFTFTLCYLRVWSLENKLSSLCFVLNICLIFPLVAFSWRQYPCFSEHSCHFWLLIQYLL